MKCLCLIPFFSACASYGGDEKGDGTWDADTGDSGQVMDCDTPTTWYQDSDGDGFGDAVHAVSTCDTPEGTVADATDCDDGNALVYPGAPEVCNDGLFNDCDDAAGDIARDACPSDGPYPLSGSDALLFGELENDGAGSEVSGGGDVDGDGLADLLIATPRGDIGEIYLIHGPVTGRHPLSGLDTQISLPPDDYTGWGIWGTPIASAGDVDGDGLPDIAVGVPYLGDDSTGGAYLFPGTVLGHAGEDDAAATLFGDTPFGDAGRSITGIGDADGDGWDDILVGAPVMSGLEVESEVGLCGTVDEDTGGPGSKAGITYLVRGPITGAFDLSGADARLIGQDGGDLSGTAVARPGDLNGDGLQDLLIGAPGHCAGGLSAGAAYAMYGPVMSDVLLEDADGKVIGEGAFSLTGRAVAGVGDVDGDGSPDVMVGAPDHDGPDTSVQGVAYLILGPVAGAVDVADAHATLVGEATGNYAGRSLSGAGDINLDGFDDLWIGSMDREAYRGWPGAGYLVLGPVTGSVDLETVVTKFIGAGDDYAGWSVAGVGDTNGDGLPDLFIGLPANSEFGTYAGAAALILGGGPAFDGTWGP